MLTQLCSLRWDSTCENGEDKDCDRIIGRCPQTMQNADSRFHFGWGNGDSSFGPPGPELFCFFPMKESCSSLICPSSFAACGALCSWSPVVLTYWSQASFSLTYFSLLKKRQIRGEGIVREFALLYLKWITNKDLLYSIGNTAQPYVAAWMGGEFEGEWVHVYVCLSPFTARLKLSQHC